MDCLFCKFASNQIPTDKVYEDDNMFIIRDISPKAALHYLLIPKKHYPLFSDMTADDEVMFGTLLKKLSQIRDSLGLENGYRIVINQGKDAGQTVHHLHVHILGGQELDFTDHSSH